MPHHGRTPAAWTGIAIAFIGFVIGCYGALVVNWLLMGVGAAVLVLALVVVQVMRALDLGAD
ncbi:HGxxPAAW family protein [Propionibacteriaceae bacterium Y2011]